MWNVHSKQLKMINREKDYSDSYSHKNICKCTYISLHRLSSCSLWDICLLRSAVWYLQHDDLDGDSSGPVHGDHQAPGLPGCHVPPESPEHFSCGLALLLGLEPSTSLWLEWVNICHRPWNRIHVEISLSRSNLVLPVFIFVSIWKHSIEVTTVFPRLWHFFHPLAGFTAHAQVRLIY